MRRRDQELMSHSDEDERLMRIRRRDQEVWKVVWKDKCMRKGAAKLRESRRVAAGVHNAEVSNRGVYFDLDKQNTVTTYRFDPRSWLPYMCLRRY